MYEGLPRLLGLLPAEYDLYSSHAWERDLYAPKPPFAGPFQLQFVAKRDSIASFPVSCVLSIRTQLGIPMRSRLVISQFLRLLFAAILTCGLTVPVRAIEYNMDVDADGAVLATTDGLLLTRYLLGIRGTALTAGALGPTATRTASADIEAYLAAATGPVPTLQVFSWAGDPGTQTYTTATYVMLPVAATLPTLTAVKRVTASGSATITPNVTGNYRVDICYQHAATLTVVNPSNAFKIYSGTAGVRMNIAVSKSFVLAAGDWKVGLCIRADAGTLGSISNNDYNTGWAIVTD